MTLPPLTNSLGAIRKLLYAANLPRIEEFLTFHKANQSQWIDLEDNLLSLCRGSRAVINVRSFIEELEKVKNFRVLRKEWNSSIKDFSDHYAHVFVTRYPMHRSKFDLPIQNQRAA